MSESPSLPSSELLATQAEWLAPARARLLRRAAIAHRRRVLELGAGRGAVTGELVRRSGGPVVAVDVAWPALRDPAAFAGAGRVGGDGRRLPFADATFDLAFSQLTLLWIAPLEAALRELWRVLQPGGVLVALEPDYGGMIEYPPEVAVRELWLAGLACAGADPCVGRKLPALFEARGFTVRVELLEQVLPPHPARFDLLQGLPLILSEQEALARARRLSQAAAGAGFLGGLVHLPFFLITAMKPSA